MSDAHDSFNEDYRSALVEVALPAFARAGEFAREHGLECSVELVEGHRELPELCLRARGSCHAPECVCRISADPRTHRLCHENRCAGHGAQRLIGSLASLNEMVLDTRLMEFFQSAFALRLDYAASRHAGGFW
ncbi:hypothetical protein NK553_20035 [Pseudomonas sp. ZM23]|uniref:Uncharacterized protein n=1 Tax=Pseudomonas triclosanedens TaxID=2961893 RepID=A0ABY7A5K8_9PSED|nr:hypothetical protein [Pseudomonas triclosanedens]MCP8466248.1 hypothetical protein [Pseudomonas triclosanedens]MCP8471774.1 hypothetical protein [Pseudomonas triclosanedens]MCP8478873.1 hypothetical protein [Pseudomonas triclosanedens]WAI52334.1 hypothetical protein OU419_14115 [Pseudomonas triclosanedens]